MEYFAHIFISPRAHRAPRARGGYQNFARSPSPRTARFTAHRAHAVTFHRASRPYLRLVFLYFKKFYSFTEIFRLAVYFSFNFTSFFVACFMDETCHNVYVFFSIFQFTGKYDITCISTICFQPRCPKNIQVFDMQEAMREC